VGVFYNAYFVHLEPPKVKIYVISISVKINFCQVVGDKINPKKVTVTFRGFRAFFYGSIISIISPIL